MNNTNAPSSFNWGKNDPDCPTGTAQWSEGLCMSSMIQALGFWSIVKPVNIIPPKKQKQKTVLSNLANILIFTNILYIVLLNKCLLGYLHR